MGMEHRYSTRRVANILITLAYRQLGLVRGRVVNVSEDGAFVRTKLPLAPNTPVELVFPAAMDDATRLHRLPAIVLRAARDGAALMFTRADTEACRVLLAQSAALAAPDRLPDAGRWDPERRAAPREG